MAEEAKATEAPETKSSGTNESTAYGLAADLPDGTPVVSRAGEHEPDFVLDGWFKDEEPVPLDELKAADGELSDEVSGKEESASSPSKEAEGKKEEAKQADKEAKKEEGKKGEAKKEEAKAPEGGKEEEKKPDEGAKAKEEETAAPKKPPKGFVPEAALYEERGKRQKISQEVSELRKKVSELESRPPEKRTEASAEEMTRAAAAADKASDLEKAFTQEAAELEKIDPEDDPLTFQKKAFSLLQKIPSLIKVTKESVERGYKSEFEDRETSAREKAEFEDAVGSGVRLMGHLVPGVHDAETNKALTDFAVKDGGLPIDALRELTHPGTIIMSPGGEPRYLKEDAAYLVSFIHKMHQTQATPDLDSVEVSEILSKRGDDIRAALLEEVKKEAYNKAVADLRKKGLGAVDDGFKPIGEIPGADASESGVDPNVLVSEAEYARMSEREKMDWLYG